MLKEADQSVKRGEYDLAINKLQSAKTCRPEKEAEVNQKIVAVFEKVNGERKEAQRQRLIAENRAIEIQRQKEASDKSARANRLAAMAIQKAKTDDYTLTWHLAVAAWQTSRDSLHGGSTEPGVSAIMHDIVRDSNAWLAKPLKGHTGNISSAVFSRDGRYILTASWDSTARLWDNNGNLIKVLKGHTQVVHSAVFCPVGQFVLTASNDNTARLWESFPLYIQHHWSLHREDFLQAGVREEDLPAWVK